MNCAECKELLVEYIEGLLDESRKQQVAEHLKDCPNCRAEVQQLTNLHDRLINNGKNATQSNLEDKVMDLIVREQGARLKAANKAGTALKLRRIIMKSPLTKIAAAAVIIIAVLIGINPFRSTITFAQVIEPILNARTIICDLIIGDDENNPVMHEIIVGSQIRRTISNIPNMTMVIDLDSANMLVLDSDAKTASYVDIQGDLRDRSQSYVNALRKIIGELKYNPNIEKLDEQIIDGRKAVGFTGRGPNEEVTIWADAKTALPIRINLRIGQMYSIFKNFELDVDVDESLISMNVPAGYTLKDTQFDMGNSTEQDFIESLRVWAKVIWDGTFPDAIGTENAMKEMPTLVQKLTQMQVTEEEGTQMGMSFGKGMLFHQIIDTRGDDWKYVGAGVKFGDADAPVFWYQPQGSQSYRVIYGDLSVKDVAPENLPQ